jgi:acyl-CoA thioester hydrolase
MSHTTISRLAVRYAETDQMGVVYYANYFVWMEIGRTDFCRDCGFNYHDLEKEEQVYIAVAEASCRYKAPARYGDEIVVETSMTRLGRRVIEFFYKIKCGDAHLADGKTVHVVVGADKRPRSIPDRYFEMLRSAETP